MEKYLLYLLLLFPFSLQAQYRFDETIFMPLLEEELEQWKIEHQTSSDDGSCATRYIPQAETTSNWSKLLNIKFKDRNAVQANTAMEAMFQERANSTGVLCRILNQNPNDLTYERTFPSGENELVRMIMTKKGLHRISFVKRGAFEENERAFWLNRLTNSVVGK